MFNSTVLFPPPARSAFRPSTPKFFHVAFFDVPLSRSLARPQSPEKLSHQTAVVQKIPRAVFPAGEIFKQEVASLEVVRLVLR